LREGVNLLERKEEEVRRYKLVRENRAIEKQGQYCGFQHFRSLARDLIAVLFLIPL
jgi:hypothetical protein